jgi:hypothetical protein
MDPELAISLLTGKSKKLREPKLLDWLEFPVRVLSPEQQELELKHILIAWDGAAGMADGRPIALDKKALLQVLLNLTPDMPGLVKFDRPTSSSKSEGASNGGSLEPTLQFTGLTNFIFKMAIFEIPLSIVALIACLVVSNWLLALVIFIFGFFNMAKGGMMRNGLSQARWVGLGLNLFVGAFAAAQVFILNDADALSNAYIAINQSVFYWMALMAAAHLLCVGFRTQVEAIASNK